ncbi:hypothetical protein BC936DRAFT_137228 [Jimgerdemannia flammicorona]|uniref:Uncharacterized protein n=1 Tax=Jimgerdemannia flammicorona TaxID=994334 RepID=A0A433DJ50_9FUNG|nr:hypothetical protein BC936DRAFT_137228 [Jimgerdemannia flammicorona]
MSARHAKKTEYFILILLPPHYSQKAHHKVAPAAGWSVSPPTPPPHNLRSNKPEPPKVFSSEYRFQGPPNEGPMRTFVPFPVPSVLQQNAVVVTYHRQDPSIHVKFSASFPQMEYLLTQGNPLIHGPSGRVISKAKFSPLPSTFYTTNLPRDRLNP